MIVRFAPGEYDPELVGLMSGALDAAWLQAPGPSRDALLARLVMASAIIDEVDSGIRLHAALVEKAVAALAAAVRISGGEARSA
jgi:hypothetical protein